MDSSEVHKPSNTSPPSQNVKPLFIARLLRVNDINFPLCFARLVLLTCVFYCALHRLHADHVFANNC